MNPIDKDCICCGKKVPLLTEGQNLSRLTAAAPVELASSNEEFTKALLSQLITYGIDEVEKRGNIFHWGTSTAKKGVSLQPPTQAAVTAPFIARVENKECRTKAIVIFCSYDCLKYYLHGRKVNPDATNSETIKYYKQNFSTISTGRKMTDTLTQIIPWHTYLNSEAALQERAMGILGLREASLTGNTDELETFLTQVVVKVFEELVAASQVPISSPLRRTETHRSYKPLRQHLPISTPMGFDNPIYGPISSRQHTPSSPSESSDEGLENGHRGGLLPVESQAYNISKLADDPFRRKSLCTQISEWIRRSPSLFIIVILTLISIIIWLCLRKSEQNIASSCLSINYNVTNDRYPASFPSSTVEHCSTAPQDITLVLQFLEGCVNLGWVNASRVTNQAFVERQNRNGGTTMMQWTGILNCVKTMGSDGLSLYHQIVPAQYQQAAPDLVPVKSIIDFIRHYYNMTNMTRTP